MTLEEIYRKIVKVIDGNHSYHNFYTCDFYEWSQDGSYLTFKVYGLCDQGYGSEWTEDWTINDDGSITNSEGDYWKDFEDFESNWIG